MKCLIILLTNSDRNDDASESRVLEPNAMVRRSPRPLYTPFQFTRVFGMIYFLCAPSSPCFNECSVYLLVETTSHILESYCLIFSVHLYHFVSLSLIDSIEVNGR